MSTSPKKNDKNISYPLDTAEGRPAANEGYETLQDERSKQAHTFFLVALVIVVIIVTGIAIIPEVKWQETLLIGGVLVAGLYVLSDMIGVKIFNRLINSIIGMFKGIVNKS